jgi:(S)-sulfolactate dehydrogenase
VSGSIKRIVITEFMDEAAVASLAARFHVRYDAQLVDRPVELKSSLADADAVIVRNRTQVNDEFLAAAPRLKVIGRLGVGLDNIDRPGCKARGIEVIPATGANAQAVAEYVIGTAMLLLRGIYFSSSAVAAGAWPRGALSDGREIAGRTLGVIGFGDIGRRVGQLARSLDMRVLGYDAQIAADAPLWPAVGATPLALDELLRIADVVTLHVPLTATTHGLLDQAKLALMKPDAILINTSRGGVVDQAALANALKARRLGGAALDVFEREPLPAGSLLEDCPNLILTPHVAGVTREANVRVATLIADKVAAALAR